MELQHNRVEKMHTFPTNDEELTIYKEPPTIEKPSKSKNTWKLLSDTFTEFSENSTIHGMKFLGERKRPIYEKLFWIIVYIFALMGCYYLVSGVWTKWRETPVIVTFSEKSTPVWEIPFPAVTICPAISLTTDKFNFQLVLQKLKENVKLSTEELKYIQVYKSICEGSFGKILNDYSHAIPENNISITEILPELMRPLNLSIPMLIFKDDQFDLLTDIVNPVLTDFGLCYTFNGLHSSEIYKNNVDYFGEKTSDLNSWNLERGYLPTDGAETFPYRAVKSQPNSGLFILLTEPKSEDYQTCFGLSAGSKIYVHSPDEIPTENDKFLFLKHNIQTELKITPQMISTHDTLINYKPQTRQCYFNKERQLKYFKLYTEKNCELECHTEYMLKNCECVPAWMPHFSETPVCNVNNECVDLNQASFYADQIHAALQDSETSPRGQTDCNCLPACTSVNYVSETNTVEIDFENLYHEIDILKDGHNAALVLYFQDNQFFSSKRSELYGTTDFFANCGGLLALFLGTSVISIIEFIYFFTLRLISTVRKKE